MKNIQTNYLIFSNPLCDTIYYSSTNLVKILKRIEKLKQDYGDDIQSEYIVIEGELRIKNSLNIIDLDI